MSQEDLINFKELLLILRKEVVFHLNERGKYLSQSSGIVRIIKEALELVFNGSLCVVGCCYLVIDVAHLLYVVLKIAQTLLPHARLLLHFGRHLVKV